MSFHLIFICDINRTLKRYQTSPGDCVGLELLQVVPGDFTKSFCEATATSGSTIKIPQTLHTGLVQNFSQHKLGVDCLFIFNSPSPSFTQWAGQILFKPQFVSGGKGADSSTAEYSTALSVIHVVFNTILLFVVNKAGLILNTREGLEL